MLKTGLYVSFLSILFIACSGSGIPETAAKAEFKVWGNCGMCKKTIEKSLAEVEGFYNIDWNKDSKMMSLHYDTLKTSVAEAQKLIAAAGYDNEAFMGSDEAYSNLHECCQYDRKD